MIQAGLWLPRAERTRFHQPRHRREHLGELIQIDGCAHRWFEDRGPPCTLLVFVDDATSRLMALGCVPSESTFAYFEVLRRYLEAHVARSLALSDQVLAGPDLPGLLDHRVEEMPVGLRQGRESLQLAGEQVRHGTPPWAPGDLAAV